MRYRILIGLTAILAFGSWTVRSAPPAPSAAPEGLPKGTLADLFQGRATVVDLTWTLNDKSPYWPAENYQPFKLTTIATLEKNGVLSKSLSFPEHLGTHLDAPNHFEKGQPSVEMLAAEQLFAPGIVIDVSLPVESDADYRLTVADVVEWEKQHGRIPEGAVVLLRTGWGRHWTNFDRYKNQDVRGKMHFPGYSAEAARWLVEKRNAKGLGIDTLSVDFGLSTDFAVHHVINGAGRYGLENVAQLDKLPARGFGLIIAPIKVEAGTGGPTRIFAVL
ncbi:MAG: cyclase family protein [Planctomycetaceae bacterium]|nr:cyclase family protein [Planctomycetaceae bacterium]